MKEIWKEPTLEVLNVSMTMKKPGHGGGGSEEDPDFEEPNFDS